MLRRLAKHANAAARGSDIPNSGNTIYNYSLVTPGVRPILIRRSCAWRPRNPPGTSMGETGILEIITSLSLVLPDFEPRQSSKSSKPGIAVVWSSRCARARAPWTLTQRGWCERSCSILSAMSLNFVPIMAQLSRPAQFIDSSRIPIPNRTHASSRAGQRKRGLREGRRDFKM